MTYGLFTCNVCTEPQTWPDELPAWWVDECLWPTCKTCGNGAQLIGPLVPMRDTLSPN